MLSNEEFKKQYMITAIRSSKIYGRTDLRRYVSREFSLVPSLRAEALALLDDPDWMGVRYGMTPAGVCHELWHTLVG